MSSLKLKHSGGNSMSIEAPATNPASNLALKLPATIGSANQFLKNSGTAGTLGWSTLVEDSSGTIQVKGDGGNNNKIYGYDGSSLAWIVGCNNSDDPEITNFRSGSLLFKTDGTERMRVDSSGRLLVNSTSTSIASKLISTIGTGTGVTWDQCGLAVTHASGANTKSLIGFGFSGNGGSYPPAAIGSFTNSTSGNENNNLAFFTRSATSDAEASERMRINSDGVVMLNSTYAGSSTNGDPIMLISPRISQTSKSMGIKFQARADVYDVTHIQFEHGVNQQVMGNITSANAGATSYNTSSDYRLKENVVNLSDGITRLKTLKPKRFNFIIDEAKTLVDGFLAHEVTAVPEAITGTKDEVDSDNKPVYQGIDQSKLVPLLTAALQEAIAKIETLETKVAALEAG